MTATSVTAQYTNGILQIGSNASGSTILGFALAPTAAGTGTYTLGPVSATNAELQVGNPAQGWQAGVGFGSGSITLTSLTSTTATGTFQFVVVSTTGGGNRNITSGTFSVTFTAATPPPPTTSTNTFSAVISGTPWSANLSRRATVVGNDVAITGQDTNGRVITLVLDGIAKLSINPPKGLPAPVSLGPTDPSVVTMNLGATDWDNKHAGAAGEAQVSAMSGTHITGTFTVTLVGPVGTPNAVITNGQFDMDIQ